MGICGESSRKKNKYENSNNTLNNNKGTNLVDNQKYQQTSIQSRKDQTLNKKNLFSK